MRAQEASFLEYIEKEQERKERALLKDKIPMNEEMHYFNYGLTRHTWNMLCNKQIYMKFERLFIEKQLHEVRKKEREFQDEV